MKSFIFSAILFLSFCLFANTSTEAQVVTGMIADGTVERGKTARGNVTVTIPGGLHVNSNRPSSEYAIPTVVSLKGSGLTISGATYPRGKNRKFQFAENPINVYEGRVKFPFTVTVPANFKGNFIRVRASVRYQACTEEICYPPKTKNIVITAKVS